MELADFRDAYREAEIGPRYSGLGHAAFTLSMSLAVIIGAALQVRAPSLLELLTIPATFLFATFAEYHGHRRAMHRPRRGLRLVYRRHTLEHHRFFTHERMAFDTPRDFKIMLFPPVLLLFFLGGMALPIGAALFFLATPNVGWLYLATAMAYYLSYELLHFAYHCPDDAFVWRVPGMKALQRHHRAHHDPALMSRHNFNITFPIFDAVYGTTWRENERPTPTADRETASR
jgi:hypothetical protein